MSAKPFLLDGRFVENSATHVLESPWLENRTACGAVCVASSEHVRLAASASARVFPEMRAMPRYKRSDALRRISAGLANAAETMAASIRDEAGKPMALARNEVQRAIRLFQTASEEALRPVGEIVYPDREPHGEGKCGRIEYFPLGPILGISPFNFPLNLAAHKIAPALVAGCPIVLKPPPQAPGAALRLGEIVLNSGFPAAALQVLPGGLETGQALCACPEFAAVSFTGSAKAGWAIKRNALAHQKVLLELGGNAPAIVDASADVSAAAAAIATAGYVYAGQVCIKTQRVFVHRSVADEFERKLAEKILRDVAVSGDSAKEDALVGPLIDVKAADRVESWVQRAMDSGARVLIRGERRAANLISPWLLESVPDAQPLSCEEVFGPVVTLDVVADFDEAISRANASKYGLQASVFTQSLAHSEAAFQKLDFGAVLINLPTTFRLDSQLYGGVKESGFGREGVAEVVREFSQPKLMVVKP